MYVMDNKASKDFLDTITEEGIEYQLFPPNKHMKNAAKRILRTFFNHLLDDLETCDPEFPIRE